MNITIEKADPADAGAIIEYLKQVGQQTDFLTFGFEGLSITEEAEALYISRLKDSHDGIMLIAKYNGKGVTLLRASN